MKPATLALCIVTPALFLALSPAKALERETADTQMAAGACLPFFATTQAHYGAGGMTNAGTAQFYAVCSMGGFWQGDTDRGSDHMAIVVNNPTAASINVSCTARPGYIFGTSNNQLASPKSAALAAGTVHSFVWFPSDFGVTKLANANFTCTVPVGITIQYVETAGYLDVGG
jgi:hypothetical protein